MLEMAFAGNDFSGKSKQMAVNIPGTHIILECLNFEFLIQEFLMSESIHGPPQPGFEREYCESSDSTILRLPFAVGC